MAAGSPALLLAPMMDSSVDGHRYYSYFLISKCVYALAARLVQRQLFSRRHARTQTSETRAAREPHLPGRFFLSRVSSNIAGCATTLAIPSCFREFYTTNQESLGDFYSPRGHAQQNDKSWPCLLDVTGSMQGISFVHHKRFTCIFLQGDVLPGSAWGNATCLQRRGLHLKRSG